MKCLTYLGNKRKQLDQILAETRKHTTNGLILDLFSGSGVVSTHFKANGYAVHANDIAPYTYPINKLNLEYTAESLNATYPYLDKELAFLNALTEPPVGEEYFSRYYSENPKMRYPRLFYTTRNGKFIDAVLYEVYVGYHQRDCEYLKDVILADLLYKMSKYVNSSGHFKTFHKEFGGLKKKHDLVRIIHPITIERPEPPDGPIGKAFCMDAATLVNQTEHTYDLIYLDPPYNQHQYSGNYHILEYVCLPREKRYVPKDSQVSGISPNLYKSPYCSKIQLVPALQEVITACCKKTKVMLFSFHASDFIKLEQMIALTKAFGAVDVVETTDDEHLITLKL